MKQNGRKPWVIQHIRKALGPALCENLFSHAILGCDTTSSLFGIGKATILRKMSSQIELRNAASVFHCASSTEDSIVDAGEEVLKIIYGGKVSESLGNLRYAKFAKKVAVSKSVINPASLPPTSHSAKFHLLRVYFQVQSWLGNSSLNPVDWRWQIRDGTLVPVMSHCKIAPDSLFDVVKCSCKSECSTLQCSCRKHGLECTPACSECKGTSCTNCQKHDADSESDSDILD
jgi:hypothetical protein